VECAVPDKLARVAALLNSASSRGIDIAVFRNIVGVVASISIFAGPEHDAKDNAQNDEQCE
jgi:hypothetical protein